MKLSFWVEFVLNFFVNQVKDPGDDAGQMFK